MRATILVILIAWVRLSSASPVSFSLDTVLMGVSFSFTAVGEPTQAKLAVKEGAEEVARIERLISSWSETSETARINRMAGLEAVPVSEELYWLISRSLRVSQLSNGYFDISFASIHQIWDFVDFDQSKLPSQADIEASVELIDYRQIALSPEDHSVYLKHKGMKIGFGAIGKGYAANRAKMIMEGRGIDSGVVNAGGDVLCWGSKLDGSAWNIGVLSPEDDGSMILTLPVHDAAVVTSGNYKKFIEIDGARYCHIINPKTGWPVRMLSSVTVIADDAEIADALATTVFVLGVDDGLGLVNRLDQIECIIVEESGEIHFSKNLKDKL